MKFIPNDIESAIITAIKGGHIASLIVKVDDSKSIEGRYFLSQQEQERANKYLQPQDRNLSIVSHAIKRNIISKLTDVPILSLNFETGERGKPDCSSPSSPFFNISHSGKFVAVSFSAHQSIGVDIEFPRGTNYRGISAQCLNPKELCEYEYCAYSTEYFLTRWTQKEALTKMNGGGLSNDFNKIDIQSTNKKHIYSSTFFGKEAFIHTSPIENGFLSVCQESKEGIYNMKSFHII